jgi:hypothetical protein
MRVTFVLLTVAAVLAGCVTPRDDGLLASTEVVQTMARAGGDRIEVARFSRRQPGEALAAHWQPYIILPSKPRTDYQLVRVDGAVALQADADKSASGKVRRIRVEPQAYPWLEWRWRAGNLIPGADKRVASLDDSPARLIVSFHGDAERLDFHSRAQFRLARAISGQSLPYATLMYVWSNELPVGTVIVNPHTDRVRSIVVASGPEGIGQWLDYRRNVLEDYRQVFGEEPWDIVAVGLMTDTDNTRQKARCLYGDITFLRSEAP